jgi:hypothetical protein
MSTKNLKFLRNGAHLHNFATFVLSIIYQRQINLNAIY